VKLPNTIPRKHVQVSAASRWQMYLRLRPQSIPASWDCEAERSI
jgi:hypothetical protein